MKNIYRKFSYTLVSGIVIIGLVHAAQAAFPPSLSINAIQGGSLAQATIFGADPGAQVILYYPSTSSVASLVVGTTNSSGYLSVAVDAQAHGIAPQSPVYVTVDNAASPSVAWPSYTVSAGAPAVLSLSQSAVTLNVGQSTVVSASIAGSLSISSNTNPAVATATVATNQASITATGVGQATITLCAASACSPILVTVQSNGTTAVALQISPDPVTMAVGQNRTVTISGANNVFISSNTNSAVASAVIGGTIMTITGIVPGTTVIGICASINGSTSCTGSNVTVLASAAPTPSATPAALAFSPSEVNMSTGMMQTASILGGVAPYYVQKNSGSGSVTANVNGSNLQLTGLSFGGANITVCSVNTQCGNVYAYVAPGTSPLPSPSPSLSLSASSVASPSITPLPSVIASTTVSVTPTFKAYLHLGSKGAEVRALQQRLKDAGLYSGPITGTFGGLTTTAVKAYQAKHKLQKLGAVGPATRKLLNAGL